MIVGTTLERKSFELCQDAHAGQPYGDEEYFHHPLAVANLARQKGYGSFVIATCLLHDTLEDTSLTAQALFEHGIPLPVIWAVWCMTYTGDDESEKISKALSTPISHVGKLCDATKNKDKCIETRHSHEKYDGYLRLLDIDLPSPYEVDSYCFDFLRHPEDVRSELQNIQRAIMDTSGPILSQLRSRAISLTSVLLHQESVIELLAC
jgi:hypothetical protein